MTNLYRRTLPALAASMWRLFRSCHAPRRRLAMGVCRPPSSASRRCRPRAVSSWPINPASNGRCRTSRRRACSSAARSRPSSWRSTCATWRRGGSPRDTQMAIDNSVRSLSSPVFLKLTGTTPAVIVLEAMIAHSDNTATDVAMARGRRRSRARADRPGRVEADAGSQLDAPAVLLSRRRGGRGGCRAGRACSGWQRAASTSGRARAQRSPDDGEHCRGHGELVSSGARGRVLPEARHARRVQAHPGDGRRAGPCRAARHAGLRQGRQHRLAGLPLLLPGRAR